MYAHVIRLCTIDIRHVYVNREHTHSAVLLLMLMAVVVLIVHNIYYTRTEKEEKQRKWLAKKRKSCCTACHTAQCEVGFDVEVGKGGKRC